MSAQSPLQLVHADSAVRVGGHIVRLTAAEYTAFERLVRGEGEPVEHIDLLRAVYGNRVDLPASNCLEVLISRLRKKLVAVQAAQHGIRLLTRRGFGYQLVVVHGGAL